MACMWLRAPEDAPSARRFKSHSALWRSALRRQAPARKCRIGPSQAPDEGKEGQDAPELVLPGRALVPAGRYEGVFRPPLPRRRAGPTIDLTVRRSVRGHVKATTGEPLAGATITLVGPKGDEAGHTIADEDGSFALSDLGEGTYTLVAAAPNFRAAASVVALRANEARATVSLLAVGTLAGKVTRAKDAAPLAAELVLLDSEGSVTQRSHTDRDGVFHLGDVPEGTYELVLQSPSYRPHALPVEVKRGSTSVIDITLTGAGYLYGAVASATGAWVPGIPVKLIDRAGVVVATTSTDSAGSYHFPGIEEGRYTVTLAVTTATSSVIDIDAGKATTADLTLDFG